MAVLGRRVRHRIRGHARGLPPRRRPGSVGRHHGTARGCAASARARADGETGAPAPGLRRGAGGWATPHRAGGGERVGVPDDAPDHPAAGRQTTATNLCSSTAPGLYLQTVALVSGGAPLTFHYTLAGLVLTPQSVDTPNVAKFSVTSASVAEGLSATVTYR